MNDYNCQKKKKKYTANGRRAPRPPPPIPSWPARGSNPEKIVISSCIGPKMCLLCFFT
ncbi:hypothetical protein Hanom_Chr15g01382231 [Helianthus anomalus]